MSNVRWKVRLEGSRDSLIALSECFTDPTCRITDDEGAFYLTSSYFVFPPKQLKDADPSGVADIVRGWAKDKLSVVNGATYLQFRCYSEVSLGEVVGFYDDGRGYVRLRTGGGTSERIWTDAAKASSNPGHWIECAINDRNVSEALTIYGQDTADFTRERAAQLYNVLEIIRDDVGDLKAKPWVPWTDYSLCKRSLNQYRHARPTGTPPPKPMAPARCHTLVRLLLQSWIEEKMLATQTKGQFGRR